MLISLIQSLAMVSVDRANDIRTRFETVSLGLRVASFQAIFSLSLSLTFIILRLFVSLSGSARLIPLSLVPPWVQSTTTPASAKAPRTGPVRPIPNSNARQQTSVLFILFHLKSTIRTTFFFYFISYGCCCYLPHREKKKFLCY